MDEVRWGIIGCGDVTEKKSGPAFNKVENSRLIAVMRRDQVKAEDYAKRHHVPKWYDQAGNLIHDPEVNAIYIATPPLFHKEYTIKALEAGKPVYVEKPMAANYNDCLEMNRAANKAGIPIYVAYYRRSLPYFMKIKELLDSGSIGNIRFIQIRLLQSSRPEDTDMDNPPWRIIPKISGAGYFYDMGSHQIDLMYYLFGKVKKVYGRSFNFAGLYKVEDTVTAIIEFENGIILNGIWSFTVPPSSQEDLVEIIGDEGKITFSTFDIHSVVIESIRTKGSFNIPHPENIQFYLIQSVVEELLGKGKCPSTGETGEYTNWIMDKILGRE